MQVFTYCAAIARIQKLQQTPEGDQGISSDAVLGLWRSLVEVIESQLTLLVTESAYRCQLVWAPTYPALTIAFISKCRAAPTLQNDHANVATATFAIRVARWHPTLINRRLVLQRVRQILEYLKQPPYPDIHRTVQIFVNYAGALLAEQDLCNDHGQAIAAPPSRAPEVNSTPRSEFTTSIPEQAAENPMIRMDKDTDLTAPLPSESRPEPVLPRLLGFDIPNWNLTAPIADSFDLFEEGQTDIFDFLPDLCRT